MSKKTTSTPASSPPGDQERPDFDASMDAIESIIEQIESGELTLEEQLAAYERGARLLKQCRGLLDVAEQRVEQIDAELERLEGSGPSADEETAQER